MNDLRPKNRDGAASMYPFPTPHGLTGIVKLTAMGFLLLSGACFDPSSSSAARQAAVHLDSLQSILGAPHEQSSDHLPDACDGHTALDPVGRFTWGVLDDLEFDCAIRTVSRMVQRPTAMHIAETRDLVAWRLSPQRPDTIPDLHIAVFYDSTDATVRGLAPLTSVLAAIAELDSAPTSRGIVVTIAEAMAWRTLGRNVSLSSESEYVTALQTQADSGPAPPVRFAEAPGWTASLQPPGHGLPFATSLWAPGTLAIEHERWRIPASVSKASFGDEVTLRVSEATLDADNDADVDMHHEMARVSHWALQEVVGNDTPLDSEGLSLLNRTDLLWLSGILGTMICVWLVWNLVFLPYQIEIGWAMARIWWMLDRSKRAERLAREYRAHAEAANRFGGAHMPKLALWLRRRSEHHEERVRPLQSRSDKLTDRMSAIDRMRNARQQDLEDTDIGKFFAPPSRHGTVAFLAGVVSAITIAGILTYLETHDPESMRRLIAGIAAPLPQLQPFVVSLGAFLALLIVLATIEAVLRWVMPNREYTEQEAIFRTLTGWAFGALTVTWLGLGTVGLSSLNGSFDRAFDAQRVTHVFTVALILVRACSVLAKRGPDLGNDEQSPRVLGCLGKFTQLAAAFVVTVAYAALCVHLFLRLPDDLLTNIQIGQPPHGATSVVIVTASVLTFPLLILWFDWAVALLRALVRLFSLAIAPPALSRNGKATADAGEPLSTQQKASAR